MPQNPLLVTGFNKPFMLLPGVKFATLPTGLTATEHAVAIITDSTTATWGATIAGGGSDLVLAWWNGTAWTVVGT